VRHHLGLVALVDRVPHLRVGLIVEAVRADDGRAHHGLADLREHLSDARSSEVVRLRELRLHGADHEQQRDEEQHHRECQLPRQDQHHDQGAHGLRARHDPGDPAPFGELLQGVHVGGHARHEHSSLLLGLLGDRQGVDLPERPHPEVHQRVLRRLNEAPARDSRREEGERHEGERYRADPVDEPRSERRQPSVEDLLDEHRRGERRDRHAERHDHRQP
jgi:hypothetical protein